MDHPNLIAAYEAGRQGEDYVFVSEFVEGRSLKEILAENVRIPGSPSAPSARNHRGYAGRYARFSIDDLLRADDRRSASAKRFGDRLFFA